MKSRKLMPSLLAISTVAATTGFVTSCGDNRQANWKWDEGIYTYTTNKIENPTEAFDNARATKEYFTAASKTPKMFSEDIVWQISNRAEPIEYAITYDQKIYAFSIVPIEVSATTYKIEYVEDKGYGLATFYAYFKGYTDIYVWDDAEQMPIYVDSIYAAGALDCVNIPLYVSYNEEHSASYMHWWNISNTYFEHKEPTFLDSSTARLVVDLPYLSMKRIYQFEKQDLEEKDSIPSKLIDGICPMYTHYLTNVERK